jgi:hypothetical protein
MLGESLHPLSVHVSKIRHVFALELALGIAIMWPGRCMRLHQRCMSSFLFEVCSNEWPGASIDIHIVSFFTKVERPCTTLNIPSCSKHLESQTTRPRSSPVDCDDKFPRSTFPCISMLTLPSYAFNITQLHRLNHCLDLPQRNSLSRQLQVLPNIGTSR